MFSHLQRCISGNFPFFLNNKFEKYSSSCLKLYIILFRRIFWIIWYLGKINISYHQNYACIYPFGLQWPHQISQIISFWLSRSLINSGLYFLKNCFVYLCLRNDFYHHFLDISWIHSLIDFVSCVLLMSKGYTAPIKRLWSDPENLGECSVCFFPSKKYEYVKTKFVSRRWSICV